MKKNNGSSNSFNVAEAQKILESKTSKLGETKYILGLMTPNGKNIALQLNNSSRVQVWIEYEEHRDPRELGLIVRNRSNPDMPYAPGQSRNSNLNDINAPRLTPKRAAWNLEVPSAAHLHDLLDWYVKYKCKAITHQSTVSA